MEAARDLTALACGGAERGPGVELERSLPVQELAGPVRGIAQQRNLRCTPQPE